MESGECGGITNYACAESKRDGKRISIKEAEKLNLTESPYYHSLLGDLYSGIDNQKGIAALRNGTDVDSFSCNSGDDPKKYGTA